MKKTKDSRQMNLQINLLITKNLLNFSLVLSHKDPDLQDFTYGNNDSEFKQLVHYSRKIIMLRKYNKKGYI